MNVERKRKKELRLLAECTDRVESRISLNEGQWCDRWCAVCRKRGLFNAQCRVLKIDPFENQYSKAGELYLPKSNQLLRSVN